MARDQKVRVRIQATDEASGKVEKVKKGFGGLTQTIKANAAAIASATAAVYAMVRVLGSLARAAFDSEKAVRKVEAAMKTAGDFSKAASEDMQAFAKGLQSVGTESDESILSMVALAKGFVGTNEEAKKLVATALDFKEIASISFEEAVRRIGRATGGSVEDIAKFDRRILELTKTQLANGEATELLGEKYKGLNKAMSETAEGGLTKLENIWQDVNAAIGKGAIEASGFSGSISDLTVKLEENVGTAERLGAATAIYLANIAQGKSTVEAAVQTAYEMATSFGKASDATSDLAEAANKKAKADAEAAEAARLSKIEQDKLTQTLKDQADAYAAAVDATQALGVATSVQLEGQILAITQELYNQKLILGEHSAEWQRMAEEAGAKIKILRDRITNLRDGLGDLSDTTKSTSIAMSNYASATDESSRATQRHIRVVQQDIRALEQQAQTTGRIRQEGVHGSRLATPRGGGFFAPEKRSYVTPGGGVVFL
ncbi:MAG: phage tail length tape measure family protein [Planctomycetota bacterium]|jgi:hypothetical protein